MYFCGWLLLFKCVGLAHDDGCGRRAEARHHTLDELRCCLAEPAAMLSAVGAVKPAGMRPLAGADDTHVAAARPLAVDRAIKFDFEADDAVRGQRRNNFELVLHVRRRPPCRRATSSRS